MIDWGLLVAGAVLGVLFQLLLTKLVEIGRALFTRDQSFRVLLGTWFTYHYTTEEGQTVLREEEWRVQWRPWSGVTVMTSDPQRPALRYRGTIATRPDLVCNMEGVGFSETYHMRLAPPIPTVSGSLWGLKVGVDFDAKIFASVYLFSHAKLDLAAAANLLRNHVTSSIRAECLNLELADTQQRRLPSA